MKNRNISVSLESNKDDWETPQDFFDKLNREFNFTLDPCSNGINAKCEKFYTKKENGLLQSWKDETVFMNPPYCFETRKWIEKAYSESLNSAIVICLIFARTDSSYWQDFIFPYAYEIRFLRKRLKFSGSKNNAAFGSAIIVFNEQLRKEKGQQIKYEQRNINKLLYF